jgi:23S rRNA U2552 (ribose-2'-O)-methylase RlmE/FtsJ
MDTTVAQKPPWDDFVFYPSAFPTAQLLSQFSSIQFDASWNELPHLSLTQAKAKIEPLEKSHKWELLKKKTNPYELVYTQDNTDCPCSISVLRPLSRSYFKMIEILTISQFFDRIPKGTQKIRTAHVCEGPGGFIEAVLDRASLHRAQISRMYAMTLKPTNSHIPGWRRAYNFLQKHPEIKIHYGQDGSGDLYKRENQDSFVDLLNTGKALLFSGDGGFDFSVDYENQEKSMYTLLIASAITGLQVLSQEGMLVLKLFDLFSSSTQLLLRLLTLCFKEWALYKPSMSRPCNSERYLICRGYRRTPPEVLVLLRRMEAFGSRQEFPTVDFFSFFAENEKEYLERHIQTYNTFQIDTIEKTIHLEPQTNVYDWKSQYQLASQWCAHFRVPSQKPKV